MPLITLKREDGSELRFNVQEPGDNYIAELEGQAEEQAAVIREQDELIIQQQAEIEELREELYALKATAGKTFDENERLRGALAEIENIGAESDGKTDLTVRMFYVAHRALGG